MKSERSLLTISKRHMATDFDLEVVVDASNTRIAEDLLLESHSRLEEIENALSEYREISPVFRLNHSRDREWIEMGSDLEEVLALSRRCFERTSGAFTPFARSPFQAGFDSIEVDREGHRIRRLHPELSLGFGAIGKGYALDKVALMLDREGYADYRLGAGGSSWVFRGFSVTDAPWEVSWAWARDQDGDWVGHRYRLPPGKPMAVGVSGTAEKGQHFLQAGVSLEVGIQSAFCTARSAAEADALSTGLLVGASTRGEGYLTTLPASGIDDLCLAYVDLADQMIYNQSFETLFLREGRIR